MVVVSAPDQRPGVQRGRINERHRSDRGSAAGIFTVRDGKIVSVREYTDTQHAAQVLFLVDQPRR